MAVVMSSCLLETAYCIKAYLGVNYYEEMLIFEGSPQQ